MVVASTGAVVLSAAPAQADTLVGCNTTGLIIALTNANSSGGATLDLTAGCTYKLTAGPYGGGDVGLPPITTPITIHGNGATIKRVASAPAFSLFEVDADGGLTADAVTLKGGGASDFCCGGAIASDGMVALTNSTITGNSSSAIFVDSGTVTLTNSTISGNTGSFGGAIYNLGTVTLTNSTASDNTATAEGGAIENARTLILTDSTVSHNTATADGGGGIANDGTVTLTNSTIADNTATTDGGGIYLDDGSVTAANSTISDNTAATDGGAIWNDGGSVALTSSAISHNTATNNGGGINVNSGTVTVTNSTLSDNTAPNSEGGGIYVNGGTTTVADSTISDNTATAGGGIEGFGPVTVTGSTISGNTASGQGGGIFSGEGGGIYSLAGVTLTDSTISDNTAIAFGAIVSLGPLTVTSSTVSHNTTTSPISGGIDAGTASFASTIISANAPQNCIFFVSSGGYNLDSDGTCGLRTSHDINLLDPLLGPLQGNGGITETMAPGAGSPAIDAIPKGANGCGTTLKTDQRGVARPQGKRCDIGAYETGDVAFQSLTAKPTSVKSGKNVTFTATIVNAGAVDATGVTVVSLLTPPVFNGLAFVSVTTSQGMCPAQLPPTCNLGQFPAAGTATITAVFTVTASAPSTVIDQATVSATTGDTITGNDTKTVTVTVR